MRPANYDAVIFDLDGVITDTAKVHVSAWKAVFDEYLRERATHDGTEFRPFDPESDYTTFVDGKPRYDGVESFLASRDIALPRGAATDLPGHTSSCAVGNKKDELFLRHLRQFGVEVFNGTMQLVDDLRELQLRCAIVTSSKNGRHVLTRASLSHLFEEIVDGIVIEQKSLRGKPRPDSFLYCADLLGLPAARCVVVEDAIAGVEAGHSGGFGLTVGIDRVNAGDQLLAAGADVVVTSLDGITPAMLDQWCSSRHTSAGR